VNFWWRLLTGLLIMIAVVIAWILALKLLENWLLSVGIL